VSEARASRGRLSPTDALARRVIPRTVVALSQLDGAARLGAAARRRLHRPGRVELYFAFDDPCSAIALIDLAARLAGRDVALLPRPVVRRGIAGDPAVELKRSYAVADARRLASRSGLALSRDAPIAPEATAFLAEWTASAPPVPALVGFCVQALERLWLQTDGPVVPAEYAALWRAALADRPATAATRGVRRNERRMRRRGPYDTPAAWVHGQWFFAHDRPAQIAHRLDQLGWAAAS
jgi:2-hydroxychromene-2-carboxylate isomerase